MAARRRKSGPSAGKKNARKPVSKAQIDAERRKRFVEEYLIDNNATQAAIRAGYSKRSAYSCGPRLLENAEVAAAIEAGRAELARKCRTTAEWARLQLRQFVEANMLDFAEWDGSSVKLKDSSSLPRELGACVQEIKQTDAGVQIKLVDRRACIADLRALDGLDQPKRDESLSIPAEWLEMLTDDELDKVASGEIGAPHIAAIVSARRKDGDA